MRNVGSKSTGTVFNRIVGQLSIGHIGRITVRFSGGGLTGFIASTMNSNSGFTKGTNAFDNLNAQGFDNYGLMHADKNGNILWVTQDVNNDGVLYSASGRITLAAGKALNIFNLDAPEIRFKIQAPGDQALNLEPAQAEDGDALEVFADTLAGKGETSANAMNVDAGGNIVLEAQHAAVLENRSRIDASGID